MKKLVIAIVAVLALFTFIREYAGADPRLVNQTTMMTTVDQ
ncbi:MAG: hypothetical protein RBT62_03035 [Spirochaetia bacterium]|jgi:hypothetical protein|nr:hypothetical protein [Spirochaetia bacterium]